MSFVGSGVFAAAGDVCDWATDLEEKRSRIAAPMRPRMTSEIFVKWVIAIPFSFQFGDCQIAICLRICAAFKEGRSQACDFPGAASHNVSTVQGIVTCASI